MSNSADPSVVESYSFSPEHLNAGDRLPGIGAFMRIKNGADFLEATIRSHIGFLDEIVAVHNQSTDATPEILARLAAEFPGKLRVYNYLPKVHPPGSDGHAAEPADSPASFVNQSNFALTRTRYRVAMKLDDDHVAMAGRMEGLAKRIRDANFRLPQVLCFSGINLARDEAGNGGIAAGDPLAGAGDHFFFEVTPETRFIHHPRFEDFHHHRPRVFGDMGYWHLKYLKPGFGFANRDIDAGNPRFARKRDAYVADRRVMSLQALRDSAPWWSSIAAALPLPEKTRLVAARWRQLREAPPDAEDMARALALAPPARR